MKKLTKERAEKLDGLLDELYRSNTRISIFSEGAGIALNERIGVGAKSAKEAHNEAATRIKFSVPIALPTVDGNNTPVPANPRINPY